MLAFNKSIRLSRHDLLAKKAILSQYKRLGESEIVIKHVEQEIQHLVKKKYNIEAICPNYLQRLEQVELSREHQIVRLQQHRNFKVALHIVPSNFEVPSHTHPNAINLVHVLQGSLHIKQYSLLAQEEIFSSTLKKEQACAGLLKLRNIHHLQSLEKPSIFLSFRLSNRDSASFGKLLTLLASFLIFLSPNFLAPQLVAQEKYDNYFEDYQTISNRKVVLANKLRRGEGIKRDLYEAAQLYKEESSKGNAEAQYWLGVMYFDGLGITENTDEALRWIAMSSDQNFPKAQKLLNHILFTDDISDC